MDTKDLQMALLGPYEVRKTWAQKSAFISWVCAWAKKREIAVSVEEGGGRIRSRNIIFGDVDRAHTIITAHYDTCARMLLPNFSTPGCLPLFLLEQTVLTLIIALGGYLPAKAVFLLPKMPLWAMCLLALVLSVAGSLLVLFLMLAGPANPHTANDNTSGVMAVLLAMEKLRDKRGVAFVLFDNEEKGLLGSLAFIKAHPQAARRFVLNLDCVGDGDTMLYTGTKAAMRSVQAKRFFAALEQCAPEHGMKAVSGEFPKWIYPSDQMLFPRGTAAAALKGKRILYLDRIHTARDTVLEERNIACLLRAMEAL